MRVSYRNCSRTRNPPTDNEGNEEARCRASGVRSQVSEAGSQKPEAFFTPSPIFPERDTIQWCAANLLQSSPAAYTPDVSPPARDRPASALRPPGAPDHVSPRLDTP